MALLDGKPKSGGNKQRENFMAGTHESGKAKPEPRTKGAMPDEGGEATTQITHHADGSHSAVHSDGENSEHPTSGHLAMHLHAKHSDGEAMHVHKHMDGVTSHHVGMDGEVQGPHEHGSTDEAAEHMKSMLGDDGGNGAVAETDGISHGMGNLY